MKFTGDVGVIPAPICLAFLVERSSMLPRKQSGKESLLFTVVVLVHAYSLHRQYWLMHAHSNTFSLMIEAK